MRLEFESNDDLAIVAGKLHHSMDSRNPVEILGINFYVNDIKIVGGAYRPYIEISATAFKAV